MSGLKLRGIEVAKRYGGVLFDLARHDKAEERVLKDVTCLQTALRGAELDWSHVTNPTVSLQTQQAVVDKLVNFLKLSELFSHFLKVICHNRRLQGLVSILEDFKERHKAAKGQLEGTVEAAMPLTDKELKQLEASLKQRLGNEVTLRQKTRPNLLGGVVVRVGSLMIDASTGTQLNNLKHVMRG